MKNKIIIRPAIGTFLVLLIPFFTMHFKKEGWDWHFFDYIILGILVFGFGIIVELVNLKIKNKNHKIIMIGIIIFALLFAWGHLAVGIFNIWPLAGS